MKEKVYCVTCERASCTINAKIYALFYIELVIFVIILQIQEQKNFIALYYLIILESFVLHLLAISLHAS